jgi:hypothetical protein
VVQAPRPRTPHEGGGHLPLADVVVDTFRHSIIVPLYDESMTDRKPKGMPVEHWVERQIRMAQERGEMDNLPGAGKPLPKRSGGALEWVAQKLREENHDTSALLPPSLALPKEVDDLPRRLAKVRTESEVRDIVADLNKRIVDVHRQPQVGPPLRLGPLEVEDVVRQWRELSTGEHRTA